MRIDPGFRREVQDCEPACRILTDRELRAFGVAVLAELARREGVTVAATWAEDQSVRLRSLDAITAKGDLTMTDEFNDLPPIPDLPGYEETHDTLADHVAASPFPKLAAVAVLNSALHLVLIWCGREYLENALNNALVELPKIDADLSDDDLPRH